MCVPGTAGDTCNTSLLSAGEIFSTRMRSPGRMVGVMEREFTKLTEQDMGVIGDDRVG